MLPLLKNALLTDDSVQLLCSQNVCYIYIYIYVGYVLNYYTTCVKSQFTKVIYSVFIIIIIIIIYLFIFNNMMNK